jgi:hypothetical protein
MNLIILVHTAHSRATFNSLQLLLKRYLAIQLAIFTVPIMHEAPPSLPPLHKKLCIYSYFLQAPSPHPHIPTSQASSKQSSHNISKLALLRTRSNLSLWAAVYGLSSGWEHISLHVTSQLENLSWGA